MAQFWGDLPYAVSATLGLLVLLATWERTPGVLRSLSRLAGPQHGSAARLVSDWRFWALPAVVVFLARALVFDAPVPCSSGVDDVQAFLLSGRAVWSGGNPLLVQECGMTVPVPYGPLAMVVNLIGSVGGRAGVWLAWELPAILLLPLAARLVGSEERSRVLATLGSSLLFVPLVESQIDGAGNAFVAVAVLASLALARENWISGAIGAGFLAWARFPSLVPFLGASGEPSRRRGLLALGLSITTLLGGVAIGYAFWGRTFLDVAFLAQTSRVDRPLNLYGILFATGTPVPSSVSLSAEALGLGGAVLFCHWKRLAALPSASLVLVVAALVLPSFPFNFFPWLLPVLLLGPWAARRMYLASVVAASNFLVGLNLVLLQGRGLWPFVVLCIVTSALLVELLVRIAKLPGSRAGLAPPLTQVTVNHSCRRT
ncbi:MAG: hypothetical protein KGJ23_14070 [Euryarchaeota archaeon]|nr:hypothetical protein [Euryarchaeota archaeon]MDE1837725.1 hypothetical protein [Euryarchaeota archaeon]MDE1880949.1 hypothetical protein [Euryarchaeota archaeon]MDE2046112.1 hypothetical protein [Thermoplasmata archaeon]